MIFCFNFGGFVGSLIVLGTILPDMLSGFFGDHPLFARQWMISLPLLLVSPVAYYKGIGNFAIISLISCGSLVFLVCLVTYHFFADGYVQNVNSNARNPDNGGDAFRFFHHQIL